MASLRRQFDRVARLLAEVNVELGRHADRVRAGALLTPSIHHALDLGVPAVRAQWAGLQDAQRHPEDWARADLDALIQTLTTDLRFLLRVLRGELRLGDATTN